MYLRLFLVKNNTFLLWSYIFAFVKHFHGRQTYKQEVENYCHNYLSSLKMNHGEPQGKLRICSECGTHWEADWDEATEDCTNENCSAIINEILLITCYNCNEDFRGYDVMEQCPHCSYVHVALRTCCRCHDELNDEMVQMLICFNCQFELDSTPEGG